MAINRFDDIPNCLLYVNGAESEIEYRTTGGDATRVEKITSTVISRTGDNPAEVSYDFTYVLGDEQNLGVKHDPTNAAYNIGEVPSFQTTIAEGVTHAFQTPSFYDLVEEEHSMTVFFLAEADNLSLGHRVFDSSSGAGARYCSYQVQSPTEYGYAHNSAINTQWAGTTGQPLLRCIQHDRADTGVARVFDGDGILTPPAPSNKGNTIKLRSISLFDVVNGSSVNPLDGRLGIFVWYDRYLDDDEIADVFELMRTWRDTGAGPVAPDLPTEYTFGPIQPSDPTADVTWEISRDAIEETDVYVDAPTNMSDAEVTTDPVTKESTLHVKSVVANDAGLLRGKADAGYGAIFTGPARLNVEGIPGPIWSSIPDDPKSWADAPRVISDLNAYCTGVGTITFSNPSNIGTLNGSEWTAPAHGIQPTTITTTIDATDSTGSATSDVFTSTVTGVAPTVSVPDSGDQADGGAHTFTATANQSDGGGIATYTWDWGDISNVTGQGTSAITIDPLLLADTGKTVSCVVEGYAAASGYSATDSATLTVIEAATEYLHDFTTQGIVDGTHARAGVATGLDKDGLVKTAGDGKPVFPGATFDGTDFVPSEETPALGLQLEPASTNYVLWSEDLTNAWWDKLFWQAPAEQGTWDNLTKPDGTADAYQVRVGGVSCLIYHSTGASINPICSTFARAEPGEDGATMVLMGSHEPVVTLSESWQRYETVTSNDNNHATQFDTRKLAGQSPTTDKVAMWGMQVENSDGTGVATSYIATSGTVGNRAEATVVQTVASMNLRADIVDDFCFQFLTVYRKDGTLVTFEDGSGNNVTIAIASGNITMTPTAGSPLSIAESPSVDDTIDVRGYIATGGNSGLYTVKTAAWENGTGNTLGGSGMTQVKIGGGTACQIAKKFRLGETAKSEAEIEAWE